MNNYSEIIFGAKDKQGLLFGQVALEEYAKLIDQQQSESANILVFNIIYAGACNFNLINRKPSPNYGDMYGKFEDWQDDESNGAKLESILNVWQESRFGKGLPKLTDALKKKAEELLSQNQSIGAKLEDSPTAS